MKIRRFAATLFAFSMIAAFAVPAGAVDLSEPVVDNPDALSEVAGQTVPCKFVKYSDVGDPVVSIVDMYVPEDATKADEDMIFQMTIAQEAGIAPIDVLSTQSSVVTPRNILDTVSERNNLSLRTTYTYAGGGTIPATDNIMLIVSFQNPLSTGATTITANVTGGKYPSNSYTMSTDIKGTSPLVFMYTGDGGVFLENNSSVSVKAKCNAATVKVEKCYVYVSSQDLNAG